ncbi:MAG: Uncharacterized MFS-type transporter [uncultured Chloroflexi bacterium]|uniref:Uncharacterized MFS-type transporter n=1 Tax=uncultured Chloroflexota bacterium TaxID=166587 RepID=A0A6J4IN15_9CHLR|nr:MAG: Uncharacterized MFS-type transporter [uncultured Chloroflexota bacterium]
MNAVTAPAPAAAGGASAPAHPVQPDSPRYKWTVLAVTGAGIYMSTLSNGIVNVALPVLTREFDASLVLAQWVVLGYVLCITGLLLPAGRLADMVGRKEVFLGGFVVFAAGAALCGLAPSLHWLIAARVLQGIGGALVQANSGALVTQAFGAKERGRALGMIGSCVSAGALTGPMIGGVITAYLGWRWAFYVIVLVSVVATPVGWRLLRRSATNRDQRFDPAGAALFMAAVASLMLGLNQGPLSGWSAPATLGLFALSVGATAAFLWVEQRVAQPTVDLQLFKNRGFSAAVAAGFLSFLAISATVLLMPFYFQYVLRLPADQTGLLLAAQPLAMMLLSPVSGLLSDRLGPLGPRLITAAGLTLEVVGLGSLVFLSVDENPLWAVARLVVLGLALALFNSPNSSSLYASVPQSRYGVVGGFQALYRNLGQSIGQTAAGVLWSVGVLAAAGGAGLSVEAATQAPPEQMMAGFRLAFGCSTAVAALALVVSMVARPRQQAQRAAA